MKSYDGRVNAVDGISLDIAKGEFLTLLGPSGSGKTTTLMMIAGFEEPTSGAIELSGEDLTRRKPYERNIGVVFQNYALFPHMTVERNVAFPLRMRAFPRAQASASLASRTFFALQGDPPAVAMGTRLASALGAQHAEVPGAARVLYHLAATWAAGGSVVLLGAAVDLHARAGVPAEAAGGLAELARGALAAIADAASPIASLTGPLARGEATHLGQLAALRDAFPALHPLAVLVALEGLRQLAEKGPLSSSQEALRSALREVCEQPSFLDPLRGRV